MWTLSTVQKYCRQVLFITTKYNACLFFSHWEKKEVLKNQTDVKFCELAYIHVLDFYATSNFHCHLKNCVKFLMNFHSEVIQRLLQFWGRRIINNFALFLRRTAYQCCASLYFPYLLAPCSCFFFFE